MLCVILGSCLLNQITCALVVHQTFSGVAGFLVGILPGSGCIISCRRQSVLSMSMLLLLRHPFARVKWISQLGSSLGNCEVIHSSYQPRDHLDQQGWLLMVVDGYGWGRLYIFGATLTLLRAGIAEGLKRVAYFWNAMSVDFQYVDVYVIHDHDHHHHRHRHHHHHLLCHHLHHHHQDHHHHHHPLWR